MDFGQTGEIGNLVLKLVVEAKSQGSVIVPHQSMAERRAEVVTRKKQDAICNPVQKVSRPDIF